KRASTAAQRASGLPDSRTAKRASGLPDSRTAKRTSGLSDSRPTKRASGLSDSRNAKRASRLPDARTAKPKSPAPRPRPANGKRPRGGNGKKPTVAELAREVVEARAQQKASAEVLKLISCSACDLPGVLETVIERAARLCGARHGGIFRVDGDCVRAAAGFNVPPGTLEQWQRTPIPLGRRSATGRALQELRPVQILDIRADPDYSVPDEQMIEKMRTVLSVPLLSGGTPKGVITLWKNKVEAFTDRQIDLVATFADQAVIAIENVRLLEATHAHARELSEALEAQTATADVLRVVSGSPGDLKPVFDSILASATRLCEAQYGELFLYEGGVFRGVTMRYYPPDLQAGQEPTIDVADHHPDLPLPRMAPTKAVVPSHDLRRERAYRDGAPAARYLIDRAGARTFLCVPLLKDDEVVGALCIYRREVRPFTDRQIELLTSFADQAEIALENARLLKEIKRRTHDLAESLQQQTATSEVLQVISSSYGRLDPVFQSLLENAVRICEAKFAHLWRFKDGAVVSIARRDIPPAFAEFLDRGTHRPGPLSPLSRIIATPQTIHIADYRLDEAFLGGDPLAVAGVELASIRTLLVVPMIMDGALVGAIGIFRQEVRPF